MFSEKLIQELSPWHLLKHPFYQAWTEGTLPLEKLKTYATQYYPHVNAFPQFVSSVHSLCENNSIRRKLAHNLADEEGIPSGEPHPELWLQFAESLGVSRETVISAKINPHAEQLVDGFRNASRASYAEGLGSLFSYEYQTPEISTVKIDGLEKQYGICDARALQFFEVHASADIYHSDACKEALDLLPSEEQEKARQSALTSAKLLWNFLTEAYA